MEGGEESKVVEQKEEEEGADRSKGREGSLGGFGRGKKVDRRDEVVRRRLERACRVEEERSESRRAEVGTEEGSERRWLVEHPSSKEGGKVGWIEDQV